MTKSVNITIDIERARQTLMLAGAYDVDSVTDDEVFAKVLSMIGCYSATCEILKTVSETCAEPEQRIVLSFAEGLHKLTSADLGRSIYQNQVKGAIDFSRKVVFVFPEEIDNVSSSFVQGFFEEIITEIGIDGIKEQIDFESSLVALKWFVLENLE